MERISDIKACSQRRGLTEEKSRVREAAPLYPHNVRIFPVKVKNESVKSATLAKVRGSPRLNVFSKNIGGTKSSEGISLSVLSKVRSFTSIFQ